MLQQSVILSFPKTLIERPIVSSLIKNFDVEVNILQAHITPEEDGRMFAIMRATKAVLDQAFRHLRENGVKVVLPSRNLWWDEEACVHCTACVGQCLPGAFRVDAKTRQVVFDAEKCIACGLCLPACAYGAVAPVGAHLHERGALP
jgi:L-aspartate semialdehyde sulfurtransferase ferredoxin